MIVVMNSETRVKQIEYHTMGCRQIHSIKINHLLEYIRQQVGMSRSNIFPIIYHVFQFSIDRESAQMKSVFSFVKTTIFMI